MKNTLRATTAAISLGTIGSAYAGHVPASGPPGPCDREPGQAVRTGDEVAIGVGRQHAALTYDNTYSCVRATSSTL